MNKLHVVILGLAVLYIFIRGWSGGAMVLGNLPVPGRPTIRIRVGQGPAALAMDAGGGFWTFLLSTILSLFFLLLFGRRPRGGRVVRWCWVNFQCRGVLQS